MKTIANTFVLVSVLTAGFVIGTAIAQDAAPAAQPAETAQATPESAAKDQPVPVQDAPAAPAADASASAPASPATTPAASPSPDAAAPAAPAAPAEEKKEGDGHK